MSDPIAEYLARGGTIKRCPPAFCAPSEQAAVPPDVVRMNVRNEGWRTDSRASKNVARQNAARRLERQERLKQVAAMMRAGVTDPKEIARRMGVSEKAAQAYHLACRREGMV